MSNGAIGHDVSRVGQLSNKTKTNTSALFFPRLKHEIKICSYLRLQYVQQEWEIFPISHVVEYPMQCSGMSDRLKHKKVCLCKYTELEIVKVWI